MITLNAAEQNLALFVALRRHESNRAAGVKNSRVGNQPDWITDLNGIGGEIAVAKELGLYPDMEIRPQSKTFDLVTRRGQRIDVKTTTHPHGKLLAVMGKEVAPVDVYFLVVGTFPEYRIAGYAKADRLIREENITDLGHGKTYALDQSDLKQLRRA